jgi:hypothetical protein
VASRRDRLLEIHGLAIAREWRLQSTDPTPQLLINPNQLPNHPTGSRRSSGQHEPAQGATIVASFQFGTDNRTVVSNDGMRTTCGTSLLVEISGNHGPIREHGSRPPLDR